MFLIFLTRERFLFQYAIDMFRKGAHSHLTFSTGYTVGVLTYHIERTTMTCSPMLSHLFVTTVVALTDEERKS